jgi:hypothetical protein
MAADATNIPGAAAPDAEIKGNTQIARIRHAAPIPKQTTRPLTPPSGDRRLTPKAIFSTKPGVILGPRGREPDPCGLSIPLLGQSGHQAGPGPSSVRL